MINQIFIDKLIAKNKRIISRAISVVESENKISEEIINSIKNLTGNALRIGITGPPGAGKSTLTNQLTKHFVNKDLSVGIIAVDPTSPFSGGALLGDRVRMSEIGNHESVFIRSMATRGSLGGLSRMATDTGDILDAAKYDIIIFETVGVGQSELDIAKNSDITLVVLVPESGDSIQAMKAGLMEIADVFVLNKSDRPSSENAVKSIKNMLALRNNKKSWEIPVLKSIATQNKGTLELANNIFDFVELMKKENLFVDRRNKNKKYRIREILNKKLYSKLNELEESETFLQNLELVYENKISIYEFSDRLIRNINLEDKELK